MSASCSVGGPKLCVVADTRRMVRSDTHASQLAGLLSWALAANWSQKVNEQLHKRSEGVISAGQADADGFRQSNTKSYNTNSNTVFVAASQTLTN